jgi:hypothetical protein
MLGAGLILTGILLAELTGLWPTSRGEKTLILID